MGKIRVGIIGVGSISAEHIESYLKNENVELYAFADINPAQLKKRGEQYGITRLYEDYHDLLALKEIDAVSVCVWNNNHAPCTIDALNAGKHVLCEKPMALNADLARQMKEAAEKNGKLLMIGFVRRYGNDCRVLKDFIDNGYFGDTYYAKATYLRRAGSPGGWFGDKARSGGGPLIDLGVHVLDLTRYLMGNPKPVSVYGATFSKLGDRREIKGRGGYTSISKSSKDVFDVEDAVTALIRYDGGQVVSLEASFSLNIQKDFSAIELFGTKAGAKLDPELHIYTDMNGYMVSSDLATPTALSFNGLFANEINHFVDCVINGTECISPAEDGVILMKIIDAIYRSAETGHEVVIE